MKIFELAFANPSSNSGATFWLKVERDKLITRRTGDSMRAFWKKHRDNGIEKYLYECVDAQNDVRYSHSRKELPTVIPNHSNYCMPSE